MGAPSKPLPFPIPGFSNQVPIALRRHHSSSNTIRETGRGKIPPATPGVAATGRHRFPVSQPPSVDLYSRFGPKRHSCAHSSKERRSFDPAMRSFPQRSEPVLVAECKEAVTRHSLPFEVAEGLGQGNVPAENCEESEEQHIGQV